MVAYPHAAVNLGSRVKERKPLDIVVWDPLRLDPQELGEKLLSLLVGELEVGVEEELLDRLDDALLLLPLWDRELLGNFQLVLVERIPAVEILRSLDAHLHLGRWGEDASVALLDRPRTVVALFEVGVGAWHRSEHGHPHMLSDVLSRGKVMPNVAGMLWGMRSCCVMMSPVAAVARGGVMTAAAGMVSTCRVMTAGVSMGMRSRMMVPGMLKHMTTGLMTFAMVAVVWMMITARVGRNFLNRCRVICHVAMRMLMRWTVPAVRGMTRMPMRVRMDCMLSMWVSSVVRRMWRRSGMCPDSSRAWSHRTAWRDADVCCIRAERW